MQLGKNTTEKKRKKETVSFGLYAARVYRVSLLKLRRSQQHRLQLFCTMPPVRPQTLPASLCSSKLQSSRELQALTDTAAGFLIGSRDGGNGLKKLESTSHSWTGANWFGGLSLPESRMWALCTGPPPPACYQNSHTGPGDGWLSSYCARGFTVKLNINDIMDLVTPTMATYTDAISSAALSRPVNLSSNWESKPKLGRWWKYTQYDAVNKGHWSVCTHTHTLTHKTHITTHLIERSSALHSCLFAVLTLQSSAAVVTPIYNWYPQRGMGCLPCLKGSAQRLSILTTSCPCFRGRDELRWWERRGGWLLTSPSWSHTRWPSVQNNVLSFHHIQPNLAKLHLGSDCRVDRHQQNPY